MQLDIEQGIQDLLGADATLAGLVGTAIYSSDQMPADQQSQPGVCFWCMHDGVTTTLGGVVTASSPIYQFACYAPQLATVKDIRHSIRRILEMYSGTTSPSGIVINGIVPYGGRQIPYNSETLLYGWELEYTIYWQEDTADA